MLMRSFLTMWLFAALTSAGFIAGCAPRTQDPSVDSGNGTPAAHAPEHHDPHDVPITEEQKAELRQQTAQYPAAVAKIKELRDVTEEETRNGIPERPYQVHQALDKVDLVLQWLPGIARDSAVPKEHWEAVATTANDLRSLFEEVHQNIDNRTEPDFAAVAGEIDRKIARLEEIAGVDRAD
jgi:hypothetical protein